MSVCQAPRCQEKSSAVIRFALPGVEPQEMDVCLGHQKGWARFLQSGLEVNLNPAERACRIVGCDAGEHVRGLCQPHWSKAYEGGFLEFIGLPPKTAGRRPAVAALATPAFDPDRACACCPEPAVGTIARHWEGEDQADEVPVCVAHQAAWAQFTRQGLGLQRHQPRRCRIFGCSKAIESYGLCGQHRQTATALSYLGLIAGPKQAPTPAPETEPTAATAAELVADTLAALPWRTLVRLSRLLLDEGLPRPAIQGALAHLVESHFAPDLEGHVPDLVGRLVLETLTGPEAS